MPYKTVEVPVGTRYGRLVTISPPYLVARSDGRNRSKVHVRCDCGAELSVVAGNLFKGSTQSCGCLHRERASASNTTHGHSKGYSRTRLLRIWRGMRQRCLNADAQNYKWYGGKGITVTAEWNDFSSFLSWATTHGYADGLELDRKDSAKGYGPDNCRWVTKKQNLRSRDHVWDDSLDEQLVSLAMSQGRSPYDLIKDAVVEYLARAS